MDLQRLTLTIIFFKFYFRTLTATPAPSIIVPSPSPSPSLSLGDSNSNWPGLDTIVNLVDEQKTDEQKTETKTDTETLKLKIKTNKRKRNSSVEDVMTVAKGFLAKLDEPSEKNTPNRTFVKYIFSLLEEMSADEAKQKRRRILEMMED